MQRHVSAGVVWWKEIAEGQRRRTGDGAVSGQWPEMKGHPRAFDLNDNMQTGAQLYICWAT